MNLQEFERIIQNILSSDNAVRQQAEELYTQTRTQPEFCVSSLLQLVRTCSAMDTKSLACLLLRKCISNTEGNVFDKLSVNLLQALNQELFQAVLDERVESIRHKLVYATSTFIARMVEGQKGQLTDYLQQLLRWVNSSEATHRESALGIFNQMSTHLLDKGLSPFVPTLGEVLQKTLNDSNEKVALAALEAACSMVLVLSKSNRAKLHGLTPHMLQVLAQCLNQQKTEEAASVIESMIEIAVSYPSYFKPYIQNVIMAMFQIAKSMSLDESVRHLAMEFMISMAESSPKLISKMAQFVESLIPLCMEMMVHLDDDEDTMKEWQQKYEDDDSELTDYDVGLESLDRLALALGGKLVQPIAFQIIPTYLSHSDWKYRHAGLMAIAQTAEGCAEEYEEFLKDLVNFTLRLFKDPHPRVRYAAIHCAAQLSTDFNDTIQSEYHQLIVPALLGGMEDPVSKVQSHAATAVVNFVEDIETKYISPYLDALLTKLMQLLTSGNHRYVQEQSLSAISAIADCSNELFVKYYDAIMPYLKQILINATGKGEKMLRSRSIECVSLIGVAVGKEKFGPDAKFVMELLMKTQPWNQQDKKEEEEDALYHHILQAWARIARCLEKDFIPYLSYVMPPLLFAAGKDPDVIVRDADETTGDNEEGMESVTLSIKGVGDKRISIRTSVLEEKALACSMIFSYVSELKEGFWQYVEATAKVMVPLLKFAYLEDIRETAANTMPELLQSAKLAAERGQTNAQVVKQLFDFIYVSLLEALKIEPEVRTSSVLVESLCECIVELGNNTLSQEQLEQLTLLIKDMISTSMVRREELRKNHTEEYEDEEEGDEYEEELSSEEEFLTTIADLVGNVLKTHANAFINLFIQHLWPIYMGMLDPKLTSDDNRIALCVICDFVEQGKHASYPFMPNILSAVLNYASSEEADVRQAAVYGIGACAQHGNEQFNAVVQQAIQQLQHAITREDASRKSYMAPTCNAVSAIFKVAKYRSNVEGVNSAQLLSFWLKNLPVSGDYIEAKIVHKNLVELVQQNNPIILGNSYENLPHIMKIFATITYSEVIDSESQNLLKQLLVQMQQALPANLLAQVWSNLTKEEQEQLKETISK